MDFDITTHNVLVNALGVGSLTKEEQKEAVERAGIIVYQAVVIRAMEEMGDKTVDEFEKLLGENPSPEAVFNFFRKNISGFDEMVDEEAKVYLEDRRKMMAGVENA